MIREINGEFSGEATLAKIPDCGDIWVSMARSIKLLIEDPYAKISFDIYFKSQK